MADFTEAAEWINQMQLDGASQEDIDRDAEGWLDLFEEDST